MPSDDESTKLQLDVHLAEYAALSNRLTYWVTLQYATYAIAAAALGFIANAWGHIGAFLLAWASILILLLISWALIQTAFEIFTYVVYIEKDLRQMVTPIVNYNPFWEFEAFLVRLRQNKVVGYEQQLGLLPVFGFGILVALGVVIWTSVQNWPHTLLPNIVWLFLCGYVAFMTYKKQRVVLSLQAEAREAILGRTIEKSKR